MNKEPAVSEEVMPIFFPKHLFIPPKNNIIKYQTAKLEENNVQKKNLEKSISSKNSNKYIYKMNFTSK